MRLRRLGPQSAQMPPPPRPRPRPSVSRGATLDNPIVLDRPSVPRDVTPDRPIVLRASYLVVLATDLDTRDKNKGIGNGPCSSSPVRIMDKSSGPLGLTMRGI